MLIVLVENDFSAPSRTPDEADCAALQATEEATVVYDPNKVLNGVHGIRVNMGAAAVDGEGKWLSDPVEEEGAPQGESYQAAISALSDALGFCNFM